MKKLLIQPLLLILGLSILFPLKSKAVEPSESIELAKKIPLADLHMHVYGERGSTPSNLLRYMRENNIRWGGGVGHYQVEMQKALGARYIAAIGSKDWAKVFFSGGAGALLDPNQPEFIELFKKADELFKAGQLKGFGEIHIKNKLKFNPRFERSIPLDSPVVDKMYEMANRHKGFVQIHSMGGIFGGFEEVKVMATRYPHALTILSHCLPATPPHLIGKLFDKHPNVVCEISAQGPVHGHLDGGRIFTRNGLRPEWAEVIERHPTRFLVGTDPCCGFDRRYGEMVEEIRRDFLPYLSPATLRRVAYENAVERFNLPHP
ncbi:MAG: hypothetical protein RIR74_1347 [Pseudomonadota bacterium]